MTKGQEIVQEFANSFSDRTDGTLADTIDEALAEKDEEIALLRALIEKFANDLEGPHTKLLAIELRNRLAALKP